MFSFEWFFQCRDDQPEPGEQQTDAETESETGEGLDCHNDLN